MPGRWGGWIGTCAAGFGGAVLLSLACIDRFPPATSFRCQPSGASPQCPEVEGDRYMCCSDDPAAIDLADLEGPSLPAYEGHAGTGVPLFSAARNSASDSGMCVLPGSVPPAGALAEANVEGCPIPCNPNWSSDELAMVCGSGTICCQTVELDASDCVFDPTLGASGCWRPVQGGDIVGLGGLEATHWTTAEHHTLQDPGTKACEAFVGGLTDPLLEEFALTRDEVMRACLRRLGVANLRGFCLGGEGVHGCPLAQPSHRDACEQLNDAEGRPDCG